MAVCVSCKKELPIQAKFCTHCGTKVVVAVPTQIPQEKYALAEYLRSFCLSAQPAALPNLLLEMCNSFDNLLAIGLAQPKIPELLFQTLWPKFSIDRWLVVKYIQWARANQYALPDEVLLRGQDEYIAMQLRQYQLAFARSPV